MSSYCSVVSAIIYAGFKYLERSGQLDLNHLHKRFDRGWTDHGGWVGRRGRRTDSAARRHARRFVLFVVRVRWTDGIAKVYKTIPSR